MLDGMLKEQVVVDVPTTTLPLFVVQVIVHVPLVAFGNADAIDVGGVQLYDVPTPVAIEPVWLPYSYVRSCVYDELFRVMLMVKAVPSVPFGADTVDVAAAQTA